MVTVRRAAAEDLPAVVGLELDCFGEDAWTRDYLVGLLPGADTFASLWVAETSAGEILGHAILSVVFETAELQRIAVAGSARRRGIARVLLAEVTGQATASGAERLLLEVRELNQPALRLYRRAGFTELDRRPRYYRDGSTAVVMASELIDQPPSG